MLGVRMGWGGMSRRGPRKQRTYRATSGSWVFVVEARRDPDGPKVEWRGVRVAVASHWSWCYLRDAGGEVSEVGSD
jgi:hypothetical protein